MSEVYSRRIYTFAPRFGHQLEMGAAEIRAVVLNLGHEVLGNVFSAEIVDERENKICVRCSAATGELVYQMDMRLMLKILNFCERNNLDFSVGDMEVKTPDMDNWE
ncbi:hypothetical protein EU524_00085 [Candidatus Thorarchaeota archaeon]|jgi:hypothetical protein|nr:MAG: hypothetical protein EU524_00085 [Candidatus Thorarchaeota archaeon]